MDLEKNKRDLWPEQENRRKIRRGRKKKRERRKQEEISDKKEDKRIHDLLQLIKFKKLN